MIRRYILLLLTSKTNLIVFRGFVRISKIKFNYLEKYENIFLKFGSKIIPENILVKCYPNIYCFNK